jgi:hypothetical protein
MYADALLANVSAAAEKIVGIQAFVKTARGAIAESGRVRWVQSRRRPCPPPIPSQPLLRTAVAGACVEEFPFRIHFCFRLWCVVLGTHRKGAGAVSALLGAATATGSSDLPAVLGALNTSVTPLSGLLQGVAAVLNNVTFVLNVSSTSMGSRGEVGSAFGVAGTLNVALAALAASTTGGAVQSQRVPPTPAILLAADAPWAGFGLESTPSLLAAASSSLAQLRSLVAAPRTDLHSWRSTVRDSIPYWLQLASVADGASPLLLQASTVASATKELQGYLGAVWTGACGDAAVAMDAVAVAVEAQLQLATAAKARMTALHTGVALVRQELPRLSLAAAAAMTLLQGLNSSYAAFRAAQVDLLARGVGDLTGVIESLDDVSLHYVANMGAVVGLASQASNATARFAGSFTWQPSPFITSHLF